jgi:hypothetical protein
MIREPEFTWIAQLCRLHRPPLVPVSWYPPSGNPDGKHLDAIVETEDQQTRIAVEATRCYRGDRASGEAKIEKQLLDRLDEWLRDIATACLGARGYRVTFTVYLSAPLSTLVPGLQDFLGALKGQQVARTGIECALRDAKQRRHAVLIGDTDASMLPEPVLFHHGSQVYVEHIVPADPIEVDCEFREPAPGGRQGQWQTVIPMSFWTDTQALVAAIADKRVKLVRYRELAAASNAHVLWLLLVVEDSSGWDILAALRGDQNERLRTALAEQPQFDEVYLLARGPWLPERWDIKRNGLNYDGGPIWKLVRIWPPPERPSRKPFL